MLCLVGVLILGTHAHFSVFHNYAFAILLLKLLRFSACAYCRLSSVFPPPDPRSFMSGSAFESLQGIGNGNFVCLLALFGFCCYYSVLCSAWKCLLFSLNWSCCHHISLLFSRVWCTCVCVCVRVFVGVCYFSFFNTHWHRTTHIHNKWRLLLSFYCLIYVLPVFAILIKNVFITAQNADEWAE